MKKIFLLLLIIFIVIGCSKQSTEDKITSNTEKNIIGIWDEAIYIEEKGTWFIYEFIFTENNICSNATTLSGPNGVQTLGVAKCTYKVSGTTIYIDEANIQFTYDEKNNILRDEEGIFTKTSDNPCTSIYSPCK
jgi:hypothetical protein